MHSSHKVVDFDNGHRGCDGCGSVVGSKRGEKPCEFPDGFHVRNVDAYKFTPTPARYQYGVV